MGLLDRLLGREERTQQSYPTSRSHTPTAPSAPSAPQSDDERAVERYRYLLRTAPPEQVEQAHAEAFAKLTPAQRQQVLTDLGSQVPESERATSDDPRALARMATRAEMRQPGTLERSFSGSGTGAGRGMGMGAVIGGSLLASVAGAFIGTAIAGAMFDGMDGMDGMDGAEGMDAAGEADDASGFDDGGGDFGGDFGGGDFDV